MKSEQKCHISCRAAISTFHGPNCGDPPVPTLFASSRSIAKAGRGLHFLVTMLDTCCVGKSNKVKTNQRCDTVWSVFILYSTWLNFAVRSIGQWTALPTIFYLRSQLSMPWLRSFVNPLNLHNLIFIKTAIHTSIPYLTLF